MDEPAAAPAPAVVAVAQTKPATAVAQAVPVSDIIKVADVKPIADKPADAPNATNSVGTRTPQLALAGSTAKPSAPASVSAATEALALADNAVSSPAPAGTIAVAAAPLVSPNGRHTVASGDTLYNISSRYNLSIAELKTLNGLTDDNVRLGQVLSVDKSNIATPTLLAQEDSSTPTSARSNVSKASGEYVAQKGDTLYSIARKFGVDHQDIKRWNSVSMVNRLQPGQKVKIQGL
jgi:membrane-bound lytic murein transglycosylase D